MKLRISFIALGLLSAVQATSISPLDSYTTAYIAYKEDKSSVTSIALANASNKVNQPQQAILLLLPLLDREPNNLEALKSMVHALVLQKKLLEAGEYLARIVEKHPTQLTWARSIVNQMKPNKARFSSVTMASIKTGFNSNILGLTHDDTILSDYINQSYNPDTSLLNNTNRGAKIYNQFDIEGNYLHDFGNRGGLFQTFGYTGMARQVYDSSLLDAAAAYASYGLGYTGVAGEFTFPISLGYYYSGYNYLESTPLLHYMFSKVHPSYSYRFKGGSTFIASVEHMEITRDEKEPDSSQTYKHRVHSISTVELAFSGNAFVTDRYRVAFFGGNVDADTYSQFSSYDRGGFRLFYDKQVTSKINASLGFTLEHFEFHSPLLYDVFIPEDYDYNSDPSNLLRNDERTSLSFTVYYKHSERLQSALNYTYSEMHTDYTMIDTSNHDISYTLYWLP